MIHKLILNDKQSVLKSFYAYLILSACTSVIFPYSLAKSIIVGFTLKNIIQLVLSFLVLISSLLVVSRIRLTFRDRLNDDFITVSSYAIRIVGLFSTFMTACAYFQNTRSFTISILYVVIVSIVLIIDIINSSLDFKTKYVELDTAVQKDN